MSSRAMRTDEVDFAKLVRRRAIQEYAEGSIDRRGGRIRIVSRAGGTEAAGPSPSMPASPRGTEQSSEPWCARMQRRDTDLVPARFAGISSISPASVNSTGQVPCLRRWFDGIARDRCVQYQSRGCVCELAEVVKAAAVLDQGWRAEEQRRKEGARYAPGRAKNPGSRYPPWEIVCEYRGCGATFTRARRFGAKPRYCNHEHQLAEQRARRTDHELAACGILPEKP